MLFVNVTFYILTCSVTGINLIVGLISEGFKFQKEMFKGGLTRNDLARMRFGKKQKEKEPKERLTRTTWWR